MAFEINDHFAHNIQLPVVRRQQGREKFYSKLDVPIYSHHEANHVERLGQVPDIFSRTLTRSDSTPEKLEKDIFRFNVSSTFPAFLICGAQRRDFAILVRLFAMLKMAQMQA